MKRIAIISTGGTIAKTYDEIIGTMDNTIGVLDVMMGQLQLHGVTVSRVPLMNKDSLDMTPEDHTLIAKMAGAMADTHDGVVVVHGTDRLQFTGERCVELLGVPKTPIVLTGAMRPYELRTTDAMQNLTEALLAVQLVLPGVYVAMHNKVLRFPGVTKDIRQATFVKTK